MTLRSFMKRNFLPFYCICYGKRKDTWKKTRYCSSFAIGSFCTWLLCKCLLKSFIVPEIYENAILWPIVIIVAIGFTITDAIKCIILMIFITMMGKSGRSFLRALTFAFIISGPINNLSRNSEEIVRAFSCSKILAINLTRARFDLMTVPFRKTLVHMKDDIKEVQSTFRELRGVTDILNKEIIDNDSDTTMLRHNNEQSYNAEFVEKLYKNKFKTRCFRQLDNGKNRCKIAFSKALENCYERMPFILKTLICWPFKIDFVCKINIFGDPEKICDFSSVLPTNFGETYVELVDTENNLYDESAGFKVNYTIISSNDMPELKSSKETARAVAKEFKVRKEIFGVIFQILQQFLALIIFMVLYASVKYHKLYKRDLDYDNIYITNYFKHVDKSRELLEKQPLLPLKKHEKRKLIDVQDSWRRTQEESKAVTFYLLQFIFEILSGCFFLFLDYIIVSVLMIIRNNSEMSFVQEGEHTIRFHMFSTNLREIIMYLITGIEEQKPNEVFRNN